MVRILHTSDVHIGHAVGTGAHRPVCVCPVLAVLAAADRADVDVVVIAGDLFDHARLPDHVMEDVIGMLAAAPMPVAVLPGNHDVFDETSLWHRTSADGIHLLDRPHGSLVTLLDGRLHLWGRAMEEHDRSYRPLAGAPPRPPEGAYVVVGHGQHETVESLRSSPITPDEIEVTGADYVALGHVHVRRDVSAGEVAAWYSGAPLGMVASGTCNVVTIDGEVRVDAVEALGPAEGCAAVPASRP
jgi:DNA repair exonuclease SbcCD nuclease subunit